MSDNTVYAIWAVCMEAIMIARMYFEHKGGGKNE